jgi:hypothetical protein
MKNAGFADVSTGFIGLKIQRPGGPAGGFPVYKSMDSQLVLTLWV